MAGFNFNVNNLDNIIKKGISDNTFSTFETKSAHEQVITEVIQRNKNHACIVMWSIANESAQYAEGAHAYYEPLFKLAHSLDPDKRPLTQTNFLLSLPETDKCSDLADVICLNRYYGWYLNLGDLEAAKQALRNELKAWEQKYPNKRSCSQNMVLTLSLASIRPTPSLSRKSTSSHTIKQTQKSLMNSNTLSVNSSGTSQISKPSLASFASKATKKAFSLELESPKLSSLSNRAMAKHPEFQL